MEKYLIKKAGPNIDWANIPTLNIDKQLWGTDTDIKAQAQICYDENGLYVHMSAEEKDIRAEIDYPLGMICFDSCLEFFFSPDENDARYLNFEINPNCFTFIGVSFCLHDNTRICPAKEEELFRKHSNRTENGWEVFYSIPMDFLRVIFPSCVLTSGRIVRANCYKCGDKTANPHYLAWNTIESDVADYHLPQYFGEMILE